MSRKAILVVLGMMGRIPFAGVAWQALHYLEGFRRLGYKVYYVEDTGAWPLDLERCTVTADCSYTVNYLARLMDWCGLSDHWAYRNTADGGRAHGLSESEISSLFERADVLVNLSAATALRDEHLCVPVRIYLETDPVEPQVRVAEGNERTIALLSTHTHHFSYGENLGAPDCGVPVQRFNYRPTRQPIILDWWANGESRDPRAGECFTTISSWDQSERDIEWNGETYTWSKSLEFLKLIDLQRRTEQPLQLALACCDAEAAELLRSHGWQVIDAVPLSADILLYRDHILGSRGEFTVAKDQNIRLRSGWFSDRSACYLAAGRPVVTQDTGFGNILPTGEGLFAFNTMDEILAAFKAINSDYGRHSRAARAIAEEYFRAERVLAKLLDDLGI